MRYVLLCFTGEGGLLDFTITEAESEEELMYEVEKYADKTLGKNYGEFIGILEEKDIKEMIKDA